MVLGVFLDNSVKDDLDLVIFGDMLMILESTMFSQKSFGIQLLFEWLDLLLRERFKH